MAVEGGTDSVGDANYNYGLSERRATPSSSTWRRSTGAGAQDIRRLGLGKDKPVVQRQRLLVARRTAAWMSV